MTPFEIATESEEAARSARQLAALLFLMAEGMDRGACEQMAVYASKEYAEAISRRIDSLAASLYAAARGGAE